MCLDCDSCKQLQINLVCILRYLVLNIGELIKLLVGWIILVEYGRRGRLQEHLLHSLHFGRGCGQSRDRSERFDALVFYSVHFVENSTA